MNSKQVIAIETIIKKSIKAKGNVGFYRGTLYSVPFTIVTNGNTLFASDLRYQENSKLFERVNNLFLSDEGFISSRIAFTTTTLHLIELFKEKTFSLNMEVVQDKVLLKIFPHLPPFKVAHESNLLAFCPDDVFKGTSWIIITNKV